MRERAQNAYLVSAGKPGAAHVPKGLATNDSYIRHLVAGQRGNQALQSGDVDGGVVAAGQVIGLIDDIPRCADLIERMVADCRAALARAQTWAIPS